MQLRAIYFGATSPQLLQGAHEQNSIPISINSGRLNFSGHSKGNQYGE